MWLKSEIDELANLYGELEDELVLIIFQQKLCLRFKTMVPLLFTIYETGC